MDFHDEAVGQDREYNEAEETAAQSKRQLSASTPKKVTLLDEFEALPTHPPLSRKESSLYTRPLPSSDTFFQEAEREQRHG